MRVAFASTGFLIGVAIAPLFTVAAWVGVVALLFTVGLSLYGSRWVIPVILTLALITGVGYGSSWILAREQIKVFVGNKITLSGIVKEDPGTSASGQRSLQLVNIEVGEESYAGTALITLSNIYETKRGDLVTVKGELKRTSSLIGKTRILMDEIEKEVKQLLGTDEQVKVSVKYTGYQAPTNKYQTNEHARVE